MCVSMSVCKCVSVSKRGQGGKVQQAKTATSAAVLTIASVVASASARPKPASPGWAQVVGYAVARRAGRGQLWATTNDSLPSARSRLYQNRFSFSRFIHFSNLNF